MVYITSNPNHATPHYPHDPFCEHRNCPECARNVLVIMLREQRTRETSPPATRPTMTRAMRSATRFRPMGVR